MNKGAFILGLMIGILLLGKGVQALPAVCAGWGSSQTVTLKTGDINLSNNRAHYFYFGLFNLFIGSSN